MLFSLVSYLKHMKEVELIAKFIVKLLVQFKVKLMVNVMVCR